MAGQAGLEPATTGFGVRRSSQLELLTPVSLVRPLPRDAGCGIGKMNRIFLAPVSPWSSFCFSSSYNFSAYIGRKQNRLALAWPQPPRLELLNNFRDHSCTDSPTTLADRELQTLFHSDRSNQLDLHVDVVTRHDHLSAFRQFDNSGNVRRAEVKLRPISIKKRGVPSALLLSQNISFSVELRVWRDTSGFCQYLTSFDFLALRSPEQHPNIIAGLPLI